MTPTPTITTTAAGEAPPRTQGARAIGTAAPTATLRTAGYLLVGGAATMLIGAGVHFSTGADLWKAVDDGAMADYLTEASRSATTIVVGLAVWIVGSLLLGVGGVLASRGGDGPAPTAARTVYTVGSAVAIPAFVTMAAVVRLADAGTTSTDLADALGFVGIRLDDLATIALIGMGPVLLALATGRDRWMPSWLTRAAWLVGAAAVLAAVAIFTGASASYGFLLVPIGLAWTIAAGTTAVRRAATATTG